MRATAFAAFLGLIAAPAGWSATYYIAPGGSGGAGTQSDPWHQFSSVFNSSKILQPGDTLVLGSGTYTKTTTGLPYINCTINANNGTAAAPITVTAQQERQAHLASDGTMAAFRITQCSYWVIEGLHTSSVDLSTTNGGVQVEVFLADHSSNLTIRRNISDHNNRYGNDHTFGIEYDTNVVVEENEAYYFHRHGFAGWQSSGITYRRNYVNSRGYADIPGGYPSGDPTEGDEGLSFYESKNSLAENNVAESVSQGLTVHGVRGSVVDTGFSDNNRDIGNIALSTRLGSFELDSRCNGINPCLPSDQTVDNNTYLNDISVNSPIGFYMRGGVNIRYANCMALNSTNAGFVFDLNGGEDNYLKSTAYSTNTLVTGGTYGFDELGQYDWRVYQSNVYGASTPYSPNDAHIVGSTQINPNLGNCLVYIPASSPMHGAGVGGSDIGANVLYRYQDGTLTTQPLWDPSTGAFPCGAQVAGLNDVAGASCFDVHMRLNVNVNGCPLPPGYGGQPHTPAKPTGLRFQ